MCNCDSGFCTFDMGDQSMGPMTTTDVANILNAGHYIDIRTDTLKPRHKPDLGAKPFSVGDSVWIVKDEPQLRAALEGVRNSANGGTIQLNNIIEVDDTVRLPSRCILTGGGLVASASFKQSGSSNTHLLSIRNGASNVWVHNVLLDGNRQSIGDKSMIMFPIMEESNNVIVSCCTVINGKSGVVIANGSSNVTVFHTESAGHSHWHGVVVQHIDCESIAILGCNTYENGGYGIDVHVTYCEIAGCVMRDNGKTSNHVGVASKAPESRNLWIHDCDLSNADANGLPLFRVYGDGRRPENVYIYRCVVQGYRHIAADAGCTLYYHELETFDENGQPTSLRTGGGGQCLEERTLELYPYEIEGTEPPVEPPTEPKPGELFTAAQVEAIRQMAREEAFQVFQEEIQHLHLVYNPLLAARS